MKRNRWWIGVVAAIVGTVSLAQLKEKPAERSAGTYRVTSWPEHSGAEAKYADEIEAHLNRLAAEGWRFHSDLVGQFGKLMVFERLPER